MHLKLLKYCIFNISRTVENDFPKRPTIYSYQVLAGGNDDEFIVFKIQPSATEDYIMDDNQIAKPKPGKVAKV